MDKVIIGRMFDDYKKNPGSEKLRGIYKALEGESPPLEIVERVEWTNSMARFYREVARLSFGVYNDILGQIKINSDDLEAKCDVVVDENDDADKYESALIDLDGIDLGKVEANPLAKIAKAYAKIAHTMRKNLKRKEEEIEKSEKRIGDLEQSLDGLGNFR